MERWTTKTPASIAYASGRGLDYIIKPRYPLLILYTPSSLSLCFSLLPPSNMKLFFFCLLLSFSLFLSSCTPPLLLLHSSLFLMCCFPVGFGCLTLYTSVLQMFASSSVVLWKETQNKLQSEGTKNVNTTKRTVKILSHFSVVTFMFCINHYSVKVRKSCHHGSDETTCASAPLHAAVFSATQQLQTSFCVSLWCLCVSVFSHPYF